MNEIKLIADKVICAKAIEDEGKYFVLLEITKDTYEEIKQKIKEATTEFEDFENRPYSKLCYECRQFKNCEIKQKYRDGSLFACGSFVNKK